MKIEPLINANNAKRTQGDLFGVTCLDHNGKNYKPQLTICRRWDKYRNKHHYYKIDELKLVDGVLVLEVSNISRKGGLMNNRWFEVEDANKD